MVGAGMSSHCQMVFQRNVILKEAITVVLNMVIVEVLRSIAIALNVPIIAEVSI